ncbi:MAG: transcriptional regulator [Aquipseudomonas alcaligenes]|uniref:Transcriptional regulator n=1 Tax=Aquipseudomonas alcaligenes TaxID=43263 RepID=A0A5C7WDU8_AQUAC|nr:MAG: transcriptional regulator [Pseudomonas alcaligenes]
MSQHDNQPQLRLLAQPRPVTVELLFRMFGTVLIPVEDVRARLFRYLNEDSFKRTLATPRLPIPVTTLEDSNRAIEFFEIHHLAAHIEHRAGMADEELVKALTQPQQEPQAT